MVFTASKLCKPAFSLLLGDQVYLDLPTLKDFPSSAVALAAQFEGEYARNWFDEDGFRNVLSAAPSIAMPDDHEYWNNFPNPSPFIQNSWTQTGRDSWRSAARAMYDAFQAHDPVGVGGAFVVNLPPVSIFLADTRTLRQEPGVSCLSPASLTQLSTWVSDLNTKRHTGIFVAGQSLFDPKAGSVGGFVGDKTLSNYWDFQNIMEELSRAESPLFFVTGDVHWGRVVQVRDAWRENRLSSYEIITSPVSLVQTVGADQLHDLGNALGSIFGHRDPWPRHAAPEKEVAWQGSAPARFDCAMRHGQRGNQLAVLSLRRFAGRLQAQIRYFGLHADSTLRTVVQSDPFDIAAGIERPFH